MNKNNNICNIINKSVLNLLISLFSFTCIFPILWMINTSLKTQQEFSVDIISLPDNWFFFNYLEAVKTGRMQTYFANSVFVSFISVILIVMLGFVTGYFLSRYTFKGKRLIYILFLAGMLIPVHSLLIPIFIQFKTLGLLNERITLIFPYVAFGLPLAIFLFDSFIKSIPKEMEEASYMDGLSLNNTIFLIILPMTKPIMATVIIMSFLHWWNEFPFALVLISSEELKTLPIGLANFSGAYSTNYTQLMAALVIAAIPVIMVYLGFYKKIMQGMTAGAIKG